MNQLLHTSAVVLTGLLAGAFLLGVTALRRAVASFELPAQIRARQAFIPEFRALLLPMMVVGAVVTGVAALFGDPERPMLAWLAFAMSASAPLLTITLNVPVNRRILKWNPAASHAEWKRAVNRWNGADTIRLGVCIGAFLCSEFAR